MWTGTEMLVWGGWGPGLIKFGNGGRYDPVTNTWTAMTAPNLSGPRQGYTGIWTGQALLVFGGSELTASHVQQQDYG